MGKFCKRTLIPFEAAVPMGGDYDAVPFFSSSPGMTTMATTAWPVVSRRTKKQRKMMARGRHRRSSSSMFEAMFDQHHHPTHHRHELVDDDEKFELSIDVPGVKEEDIDVKLEDGLLTVQGRRMASSSDSSSQFITSKFSKSFSLDKTVDVEQITAELKNGVLTVSAPKDMKKLEENVRRIPVTAAATAAVVDLPSEDKSDENAASTSSNDDDDGGAQKTEHKDNEEEEAESMDVDKEKT